jgi:hypothetical protein
MGLKNMENKKEKKEIKKPYRITRDEWLLMRRDQKTKREIKRLALELFDKVKNWK